MSKLTNNEVTYLRASDTVNPMFPQNSTLVADKERLSLKLLHGLLETMQEMKEEMKVLRETNQRLEDTLKSVITDVYGYNHKAIHTTS